MALATLEVTSAPENWHDGPKSRSPGSQHTPIQGQRRALADVAESTPDVGRFDTGRKHGHADLND